MRVLPSRDGDLLSQFYIINGEDTNDDFESTSLKNAHW